MLVKCTTFHAFIVFLPSVWSIAQAFLNVWDLKREGEYEKSIKKKFMHFDEFTF